MESLEDPMTQVILDFRKPMKNYKWHEIKRSIDQEMKGSEDQGIKRSRDQEIKRSRDQQREGTGQGE